MKVRLPHIAVAALLFMAACSDNIVSHDSAAEEDVIFATPTGPTPEHHTDPPQWGANAVIIDNGRVSLSWTENENSEVSGGYLVEILKDCSENLGDTSCELVASTTVGQKETSYSYPEDESDVLPNGQYKTRLNSHPGNPGNSWSSWVAFEVTDGSVGKAPQSVVFDAVDPVTYGDVFHVSAKAMSDGEDNGNTVSYSLGEASIGCSLSGNEVTATAATGEGEKCIIVGSVAEDDDYLAASTELKLSIAKATPSISLDLPGNYDEDDDAYVIVYNRNAHGATASATGVGNPGEALQVTLTYNDESDAPKNAGTYVVKAAYPGSDNYESASETKTLIIKKATPGVTFDVASATWNDTDEVWEVTYDGETHPATASALGVGDENLGSLTVLYDGDTDAPSDAGTYALSASYSGSTNYKAVTETATLIIEQAEPTINWSTPSDIIYGTTLSSTQLNATATDVKGESLIGTFTYDPAQGSVLQAGNHKLTVEFTPDSDNYTMGTASVQLEVLPWATAGFHRPVRDGINVVKGGSTVPLKFNVYGSTVVGENEQTDTAIVTSFIAQPMVSCEAGSGFEDEIPMTELSSGNTSLRYDFADGQFIQNWKTPVGKNKCFRVTATIEDGSEIEAYFKTK